MEFINPVFAIVKARYYIVDEKSNEYELPYVLSFHENDDLFWFESDWRYCNFVLGEKYSFCSILTEVNPMDVNTSGECKIEVAGNIKFAGAKAYSPEGSAPSENIALRYYFIK